MNVWKPTAATFLKSKEKALAAYEDLNNNDPKVENLPKCFSLL